MPLRSFVLLLALAGCTTADAPDGAAPGAPATSTLSPATPSDLSVETDSLVDRSVPGLVVAVELPRIAGTAGAAAPSALDAANRGMRDSVEAFVRAIAPTEGPGENDVTDEFDTEGGFETSLFEADLYSGHVAVTSFSGGAHPNTYFLGLTRDLRTGAVVTLADLFRPGAAYLDTLSAHVERGVVAEMAERGEMPTAEARQLVMEYNQGGVRLTRPTWSLTPDGVRIHLAPYEVMAYAMGSFTVDVPFAALGRMLDDDGPAARLTR